MCEERDRRDRSDGPLLPFGFDEALAAAGGSYEKQLAAENILFEDCLVCPVYYEKSFCVFSENVTEPELFAMSGTVDFRRCGLE